MKKLVVSLAIVASPLFAESMEPMLIGGQPAQKGDFPEVVYIRQGNARCSATVVGPQVIMTAGHCVPDQGSISQVDFVVDQIVFIAKCEQTPQYRDNKEDLDFALCKTDKPIDVAYASIAKQGPKVGDEVSLSGYGCINPGGGAGNDGILRVGIAKVSGLPRAGYDWFDATGGAALCFGDSGGPAFQKLADPKKEKHVVMGVNSRGDIKQLSMLTSLWLPQSQAFFKSFAQAHNVEICGVNKDCAGKPQEEQPPKKQCVRLKAKYDRAKAKYEQCQKATVFFDETELGDE